MILLGLIISGRVDVPDFILRGTRSDGAIDLAERHFPKANVRSCSSSTLVTDHVPKYGHGARFFRSNN